MSDELPEVFVRVTPCPAPLPLRDRVLAAVEEKLSAAEPAAKPSPNRRVPSWERAAEVLVAASLLMGVGLNVWQSRVERAWQAREFGAPAVPSAVAGLGAAVASVTDAQFANLLMERLAKSSRRAGDLQVAHNEYQKLLDELIRTREPVL